MVNLAAQNPKVIQFAEACYDQNTLPQLTAALQFGADHTDMTRWGLTEDEWHTAVEIAIDYHLL